MAEEVSTIKLDNEKSKMVKAKPMEVSKDQYFELFGSSDDEQDQSFFGFSTNEISGISKKKSLKRSTGITLCNDDSNPYRKKYFSYSSKRSTCKSAEIKTEIISTVVGVKKDISKKLSNKTQAARNLICKAHKVKNKPLNGNNASLLIRPRRKIKVNINNDFVYDKKVVFKRKFDEIESPTQLEEDDESFNKAHCTKKEKRKKKVKKAKKKKEIKENVKIKVEEMEEEEVLEIEDGIKIEKMDDGIEENMENSHNQDLNLTASEHLDDFHKKKKVRIKSAVSPKLKKKIKMKNVFPQSEETCLDIATFPDTPVVKKDMDSMGVDHEDKSLDLNKRISNNIFNAFNNSLTAHDLSIKEDSETANRTGSIKLKAVKIHGEIKLVNNDNNLVFFCKECVNCRKKEDCGTCKHCRNKRHTIRLLPCYQRRCINPKIGHHIDVKKKRSSKSPKKKKIKQDEIEEKHIEKKNEKNQSSKTEENVEVMVVNDGSMDIFQSKNTLLHKKGFDDTSHKNTDVFMQSPIKPKLRSTLNFLTSRKKRMDNLQRVKTDTVVKLPWPNDSHEDAAWISGHHLCFTVPTNFHLKALCFLCGSAGKGELCTCSFCCESFHPYCLDIEPIANKEWFCDRCKRCTVCGLKENLLMCDKCHDCYHGDCLGPFYQKDTEGIEETWVCGKCVCCSKCGTKTPGKNNTAKWKRNFSMCEECYYNYKKGNFCPICEVLYDENDDSLKMMFCLHCEKWIHMKCEGISRDDYEILADLPENIPYICKLCSTHERTQIFWYKEVKNELNNGFLQVYYDIITHPHYKTINQSSGEHESIFLCIQKLDALLNSLENQTFTCITDFHSAGMNAFENIKQCFVHGIDITPLADSLIEVFHNSLNNRFPWFVSSPTVEKKSQDITHNATNVIRNALQLDEINSIVQTINHDHIYAAREQLKQKDKSSTTENETDLDKSDKIRYCMFCCCYGDDTECGSGRLLYAGMNSWVHINCALWSAEVYEDSEGRLKQVHEALKRGNKLKCGYCEKWGASIGCCFNKCIKSYHFLCAKKAGVIFQDDKKIYCHDHANKACEKLILSEKQLSVPRRVLVDLTRFKSLKRVQSGIETTSVNVLCGGLTLHGLGRLSEESDLKHVLIPNGYKVSRMFWSTKDATLTCKYSCEVKLMYNKDPIKKTVKEVEYQSPSVTYCHDSKEYEKFKTDNMNYTCTCSTLNDKPRKATKRKFVDISNTELLQSTVCLKCDKEKSFVFLKHSDFNLMQLKTEKLAKNKSKKQNKKNTTTDFKSKRKKVSKNVFGTDKKTDDQVATYNLPMIADSNVRSLTVASNSNYSSCNIANIVTSTPLTKPFDMNNDTQNALDLTPENCSAVFCNEEVVRFCKEVDRNHSVESSYGTLTLPQNTAMSHIFSKPTQQNVLSPDLPFSQPLYKQLSTVLCSPDRKHLTNKNNISPNKPIIFPVQTGKQKLISPKKNLAKKSAINNYVLSHASKLINISPYNALYPNTKLCLNKPTNQMNVISLALKSPTSFQQSVLYTTEIPPQVKVNNSSKVYMNEAPVKSVFSSASSITNNLELNNKAHKIENKTFLSKPLLHAKSTPSSKALHVPLKHPHMLSQLPLSLAAAISGSKYNNVLPTSKVIISSPTKTNQSNLPGLPNIQKTLFTLPVEKTNVVAPSTLTPLWVPTLPYATLPILYNAATAKSINSQICPMPNTYLDALSNSNFTQLKAQQDSVLAYIDKIMTPISSMHGELNKELKLNDSFKQSPLKTNNFVTQSYLKNHNLTTYGTLNMLNPPAVKTQLLTPMKGTTLDKLNSKVGSELKNKDKKNRKHEKLFSKLKTYLVENPTSIHLVKNSFTKDDQSIPVVNLTEKDSKENLVCYSAYLPEDLWSELVQAGIAKNDIQEIIQNTGESNMVKRLPLFNENIGSSAINQHRLYENKNLPKTSNPLYAMNNALNATGLSDVNKLSVSDSTLLSHSLQNNIVNLQKDFIKINGNVPKDKFDKTNELISLSKSVNGMYKRLQENNAPFFNNLDTPTASMFADNIINKLQITSNPIPLFKNIKKNSDTKNNSQCSNQFFNKNTLSLPNILTTSIPTSTNSYSNTINGYQLIAPKPEITESLPFNEIDTLQYALLNRAVPQYSSSSDKKLNTKQKYKKRIKVATHENITNCKSTDLGDNSVHQSMLDPNHCSNSLPFLNPNHLKSTPENIYFQKTSTSDKDILKADKKILRKPKKNYSDLLVKFLQSKETDELKKTQTNLKFIFKNEDGWSRESSSLEEIWKQLLFEINNLRTDFKMKSLPIEVTDVYDFIGVNKEFMCYFIEQLPGGHKCRQYKFQHHLPCVREDEQDIPLNPSGCARGEIVKKRGKVDMFAWLASPYRLPPTVVDDVDDEYFAPQDLPTAMKYRLLKNTSKDHVGVYRSGIEGRGLFCKKSIEANEMIIEYSGEKIRASLTDSREKYYDNKGYGCYMFRIDHLDVVDATMKGNAARFINHSCEPNCFSKIISVDGCKKIVIYALRRIIVGEELTYDYKFAPEDDKLPCYCGTKKCRKYLN